MKIIRQYTKDQCEAETSDGVKWNIVSLIKDDKYYAGGWVANEIGTHNVVHADSFEELMKILPQ